MAVLDVRFDIFLVRFDISRPIRHSVLPFECVLPLFEQECEGDFDQTWQEAS